MAADDRVRAYACAVLSDCSADQVVVTRFSSGNRHDVFRVVYSDDAGAPRAAVVRVSLVDDQAERERAELEAAVLHKLAGTGAPLLYDFQVEGPWFPTPVMCMQLVEGVERDVAEAAPDDVLALGAVVASVHDVGVDDLTDRLGPQSTLVEYARERLAFNEAYSSRLRRPLPASVRERVRDAAAAVAASADHVLERDAFRSNESLVLLHGDVAHGNILWGHEPVLIDWEYARLGDRADEVAYIFGQHSFDGAQRAAFWDGYRGASTHASLDDVAERAVWWEPVLLLGSTMWWLERWSEAVERGAPKPPAYYLDEAIRRLDRFDDAIARR